MINALQKPLGASTHAYVKAYGKAIGQKVTHTGSLDPMAEGVVVVLTGDDRFKKEELSNTEKEYEFEVLIGFETDSWDLLGMVKGWESERVGELDKVQRDIVNVLPQFVGEYEQMLPRFSARRIDGESYFDKAKRGEVWERESESVRVKVLECLDCYHIEAVDLLKNIQEKVKHVEGDFRQKVVLERWEDVCVQLANQKTDIPAKYEVIRFRAYTSRRYYIRGLVRDISEKVGIPLTTYSITRTRNGKYSLDNCDTFKYP